MPFQFILPDIGEGVVEGEIVRWHVKPGDTVKEDQTLVEIMTDKATVQIPSPKAGKVSKLHFKEGEVAKVGKALLDIETGAPEKPAEKPVEKAAEQPQRQQIQRSEPMAAMASGGASAQSAPLDSSTGDRELLATPAVRKLARDEGVDLAKLAGTGPFGRITREDVLKATQGGQVITFNPTPTARAEEPKPAPQQPREQQQPQQRQEQPPPREQRYEQAPRREERLDRQERERFEREAREPQKQQPQYQPAAAQQQQQQQQQQQPSQPPAAQQQKAAPGALETRQPIRGLRKRIYEKMHQSKSTAAHFTYVEEIDFTDLAKLREEINQKYAKQNVRLTFLPFIMKAVVAGLRKYPTINAIIDDARQELVVKHEFHLGVATQTDDGLMVPVVRNVEQKSILQLAKDVAAVSERARKRQASSQELQGSTFTITSLGALGGVLATPVINYPEVAILGVHQIKKRPAVIGDQIVIRDLANFAASFDHRIIDGYIGAQFIAEVKRLIEDPQTLFLEL